MVIQILIAPDFWPDISLLVNGKKKEKKIKMAA